MQYNYIVHYEEVFAGGETIKNHTYHESLYDLFNYIKRTAYVVDYDNNNILPNLKILGVSKLTETPLEMDISIKEAVAQGLEDAKKRLAQFVKEKEADERETYERLKKIYGN